MCMTGVFVVLTATVGQNGELPTLVRANESAVESIHRLDMRIDNWETWFSGSKHANKKHLSTWRWSKDGSKERQQFVYHQGRKTDDRSRPLNTGDMLEDGADEKVLLNWDHDRPYALYDRMQGPLDAWYRPQRATIGAPFPNPSGCFAMFHIQFRLGEPRRSLAEFVKKCQGNLVVQRSSRENCWLLKCNSPSVLDYRIPGLGPLESVEIELDGSANYLIRKQRMKIGNPEPGNSKSSDLIVEREVLEFLDAGDGVFLPQRVQFTMWAPKLLKEPTHQTEMIASSITINSDLPSDAFDFRFPEGALVRELPPVNNKVKAFLWGPDNTPVREIKSMDDLAPLPAEALQYPSPPPSWAAGKLVLIAMSLGFVLVCLIAMRIGKKKLWGST